jgi:hypothetical protein
MRDLHFGVAVALALTVLALPLRGYSAEKAQTDPIVFVHEYIRDIGAARRSDVAYMPTLLPAVILIWISPSAS